jgi:hypothetical protein
MKVRLIALALVVALLGMFVVAPLGAGAAAPSTSAVTLPVTGTIPSIGGVFNGTFDVTSFAVQNGQLVAIGTLTGTLTDALGNQVGTVTDLPLTLPVTNIAGTCDILHLELGPLDLNLLGLVVHLDRIVLDIDAQAGPGNLLGNLLCAVAGLLNGGGPLQSIAALLNDILQLL